MAKVTRLLISLFKDNYVQSFATNQSDVEYDMQVLSATHGGCIDRLMIRFLF